MNTKYSTTTVGSFNSDGEVTFKRIRNRKTQKRCNKALNSRPYNVTFWTCDLDGNNFEVDGLRWNADRKVYCHSNDINLEFGNILVEAIQTFALHHVLETNQRCISAFLGEEKPVKNSILINWDAVIDELHSLGILPIEINPKDTVVKICTSN